MDTAGSTERPTKREKKNGNAMHGNNAEVPMAVIEAAREAGADVDKCDGEDLYIIRVKYGDAAHKVLEDWVVRLPDNTDPQVSAIWAPSAAIVGTALEPAAVGQILTEANSIINHYAPLQAANFNANPTPVIGGPIVGPQVPTNVHHAQIALTKLGGRIQNPASPLYPTLMGLPSGSYICTILINWRNVGQTIALFKP